MTTYDSSIHLRRHPNEPDPPATLPAGRRCGFRFICGDVGSVSSTAQAAKNDRPTVGCIGVGGRGGAVSQAAGKFGDIVAVCDVDLAHAESFQGHVAPDADVYQENPLPSDAWRVRPSRNHMGNFFDCIKSREKPVAWVDVEARTVTSCHLTNISLRLDRKIQWDPEREEIIGDETARAMQSREQRKPYDIQT